VPPDNLQSTNCFTITIIYHLGLVQQANSGRSTKWTQSHPTNNNNNNHWFFLGLLFHPEDDGDEFFGKVD
jgi:hypothetical protein